MPFLLLGRPGEMLALALRALLGAATALLGSARPSAQRFRKRVTAVSRQLKLELAQRENPGELRITHSWQPPAGLLAHDIAQVFDTTFAHFVALDCVVPPVQLHVEEVTALPFATFVLALGRQLRDLAKCTVRDGLVRTAMVVYTTPKGALCTRPLDHLPSSFYKHHLVWLARRADIAETLRMGVKVHFLQGSFGLVLSSSADNSKFEIEPTMPVNEEMVQVVFDSAQRCRWTWRGLLRAHNGSTMWQQRSFFCIRVAKMIRVACRMVPISTLPKPYGNECLARPSFERSRGRDPEDER